jgi:hypothetical protein
MRHVQAEFFLLCRVMSSILKVTQTFPWHPLCDIVNLLVAKTFFLDSFKEQLGSTSGRQETKSKILP